MCVRYAFTTTNFQLLRERFELNTVPRLKPRYNIAPTQNVPVVYADEEDVLSEAIWGLNVPFLNHPIFNARAETIDKKPAFRKNFEERRCLVLADSFYEWKQPEKRPFRVFLKDEQPFAFAGIYAEEEEARTCCIITTDSNSLISKVHDRMPVILPLKHEKEYLMAEPEGAKKMLKPFPQSRMEMYEISSMVNSARNDSPSLWKPKSNKGTLKDFMD